MHTLTLLARQNAYRKVNSATHQEQANKAEDCSLKIELHTAIKSFLNSAYKLGLTKAPTDKTSFQDLADDPNTSYTDYLLASLALCTQILSDAPATVLKQGETCIAFFCNALEKRVKNHWKKNPQTDEKDFRTILQHLFFMNALSTLKQNNLHVLTIQIASQRWKEFADYTSIKVLLAMSPADQAVLRQDICSTLKVLQDVETKINPVCKDVLPNIKQATVSIKEKIESEFNDIPNQDASDEIERFTAKINISLILLDQCETSSAEDASPWITYYSNVFSHLTYAAHLALVSIQNIDPQAAQKLKSTIFSCYTSNKTLEHMCKTYQEALQVFLKDPLASEFETTDTPEYFKSNIEAASSVNELRTQINIYTLATTFAMQLELFLKTLAIADIPDSKESKLNLKDYLNALLQCWQSYNPNPASTTASSASSRNRLGSRPATPVTEADATPASVFGGGAGK